MCWSGRRWSAGRRSGHSLAAQVLTQLGYFDVAHLDGGMKAWREAGCPVVRAEG